MLTSSHGTPNYRMAKALGEGLFFVAILMSPQFVT